MPTNLVGVAQPPFPLTQPPVRLPFPRVPAWHPRTRLNLDTTARRKTINALAAKNLPPVFSERRARNISPFGHFLLKRNYAQHTIAATPGTNLVTGGDVNGTNAFYYPSDAEASWASGADGSVYAMESAGDFATEQPPVSQPVPGSNNKTLLFLALAVAAFFFLKKG